MTRCENCDEWGYDDMVLLKSGCHVHEYCLEEGDEIDE